MSDNQYLKAVLMLLIFPLFLAAQNTNSPYSRYGYGKLDYPALGKSKGMGGVSIGIREKNMINPANPASYSALDTMTMLFDFGVSGDFTTFKESSISQGNPNGGLDYVAMKVPLKRWWGLAVGLNPYSKVGYGYSDIYNLTDDIDYVESYAGSGGLNTFFIGTSVSLLKSLALGVNYKYNYGMITQASSASYSDASFNSTNTSEYWYLNGSSFDVGLQYEKKFDARNQFVLGATYSEKASLKNTVYVLSVTTDTTDETSESVFELPRTLGFGVSWIYDNRLTLALDYQRQSWGETRFHGVRDSLNNSSRIAFGVEYLPAILATRYYQAVKYRFGANYSDSYVRNSIGNLRNVGLTFGVGLPLRNNQRSALNVSFEMGKLLVPNASMIHENYYKLSLDITFNETWFFKRKL